MTLLRQISDGIEEAILRVEAAQRLLPARTDDRISPQAVQYQLDQELDRAWDELNELRITVNDAAEVEAEEMLP